MADKALIIKALKKGVFDSAVEFVREADAYAGDPLSEEKAFDELINAVLAYHEFCKNDKDKESRSNDVLGWLNELVENADSIDITMNGESVTPEEMAAEMNLVNSLEKLNKNYKKKNKKQKTAKCGKDKN